MIEFNFCRLLVFDLEHHCWIKVVVVGGISQKKKNSTLRQKSP